LVFVFHRLDETSPWNRVFLIYPGGHLFEILLQTKKKEAGIYKIIVYNIKYMDFIRLPPNI
jgi:hypothetical protein